MGKVGFDMQQYAQAAADLLQAYANSPQKDPQLMFQAAYCWILNKTPEKALPLLEEICDRPRGPVKPEWRQALVNACLEAGQHAKAIGRLQELMRDNPSDPQWWKVLADLHVRRKDHGHAAAAF